MKPDLRLPDLLVIQDDTGLRHMVICYTANMVKIKIKMWIMIIKIKIFKNEF